MQPNDSLYTLDQAAERLHSAPYTVREWIRDGRLRASKIGRQFVVTETAIVEFIVLVNVIVESRKCHFCSASVSVTAKRRFFRSTISLTNTHCGIY